jgi:hypothetical protein
MGQKQASGPRIPASVAVSSIDPKSIATYLK